MRGSRAKSLASCPFYSFVNLAQKEFLLCVACLDMLHAAR